MAINLALVHLGKNPSPILVNIAQQAKNRLKGSNIFLITDHPSDWANFPGKVINYSRQERNKNVSKLVRKFPELENIAGGYWLYTLERLSALQKVYEHVGQDEAVVHFESDVLLLLNNSDFDLMISNCQKCACPRFSKDRGIASIFFVPNNAEMKLFLDSAENILASANQPMSDMELLGICLNRSIINELPSFPENAWKNHSGEKLVFDGAAYGQYLFGQDPFHTSGRRISGFQNPDFPLDLTSLKWKIRVERESRNHSILISQNESEYRILNLHLHSKIKLGPVSTEDPQWIQAIREANGDSHRIYGDIEQNLIHTQRISLLNRVRLARRMGLPRSLANFVSRRFKLYRQQTVDYLLCSSFTALLKNKTRPARLYFRLHNKWTRPFYGKYFGLSHLDEKIEKYLPINNGYFVELGANDGLSQSNTKYFELFKGWKGVLIEAYEPNFRKCVSNRKKTTKTFHAACVSSEFTQPKVLLLYSNLMTISLEGENEIVNPASHAAEGAQFLNMNESVHLFEAPARTLESILDEAKSPEHMDLLSLDVEGSELEVLKGLNHSKYSFKYICVETRNEQTMKEYLGSFGYSFIEKLTDHDLLFKK